MTTDVKKTVSDLCACTVSLFNCFTHSTSSHQFANNTNRLQIFSSITSSKFAFSAVIAWASNRSDSWIDPSHEIGPPPLAFCQTITNWHITFKFAPIHSADNFLSNDVCFFLLSRRVAPQEFIKVEQETQTRPGLPARALRLPCSPLCSASRHLNSFSLF